LSLWKLVEIEMGEVQVLVEVAAHQAVLEGIAVEKGFPFLDLRARPAPAD